MKILIIWIGPWLDKGESAMLISMVKTLRERVPNVSITAVASSFQPQEIDIIRYGEYDIKILHGLFSSFYSILHKLEFLKFRALKAMIALPVFLTLMIKTMVWLILYKSLRLDVGLLIRDNKDTVKEYRDADWILFCGGENIVHAGLGTLMALCVIIFSKLLGKPVMIYANSLGPFNQKYSRPLIKYILNKVDVITTREAISKSILDDIGVTAPVFVTADAAFSLPHISQKDAMALLEHETGIPKNKLVVGITAILWHFPSETDDAKKSEMFENYLEALAGAADHIIEKLQGYVIFFPHTNNIIIERDDRRASRMIFDKIQHKSKVILLTDDYTPEQLKGMYGCTSLFIGTRFHSCIFALSMNVPVITIGYTHKAEGIMKMLDLDDYVCDINTITAHELTSKIDKIWAKRDEVKKKLEEKIRVMQAKSMDNARLAIEYLRL